MGIGVVGFFSFVVVVVVFWFLLCFVLLFFGCVCFCFCWGFFGCVRVFSFSFCVAFVVFLLLLLLSALFSLLLGHTYISNLLSYLTNASIGLGSCKGPSRPAHGGGFVGRLQNPRK